MEENQVSRLCGATRNNVADAHQTVCSQSADAPTVSTVIDNPRNKSRAVKGSGRATATPNIGVSQIFFCFTNHIGKSCVRQSFARNVIVGVLTGHGINVITENVGSVAVGLEQYCVTLHFILRHTGTADNTVQTFVFQFHIQDIILILDLVFDFDFIFVFFLNVLTKVRIPDQSCAGFCFRAGLGSCSDFYFFCQGQFILLLEQPL